jgi:hypothetical protein
MPLHPGSVGAWKSDPGPPIIRFRTYYCITGILFIFLIILLIRYVARKMVTTITTISQAAEKGGEVLLSHSAYAHVAKDVVVKNSFGVQMKGIHEFMKLYVVENSGEAPGKGMLPAARKVPLEPLQTLPE